MAHIHANGDEEQRPRTEAEIAAIVEQNRIAAQSNVRSGKERRVTMPLQQETRCGVQWYACKGFDWKPCRRGGRDQRATISTFERDMLFKDAS